MNKQTIQQPKCNNVKTKKNANLFAVPKFDKKLFELVKTGFQCLLMKPALLKWAIVLLPDLADKAVEIAKHAMACLFDLFS